jgi:hypothetical protein
LECLCVGGGVVLPQSISTRNLIIISLQSITTLN